jgi:hypothetical protein
VPPYHYFWHLYIYSVCTLLSIIIYTQYTLYKHHCNPSTIASIYTIIPLPIKLITWQRVRRRRDSGQETVRSDLVTAREDRRSYKNISIYVNELPPTPTLWVPLNSPPINLTYQKGEGSSPRLSQTCERPDARTPSKKPTPRKNIQGDSYYIPPLTYQNQACINASLPVIARAANHNQARINASLPVIARAAHHNQTRINALPPAMPRAVYLDQIHITPIVENDVITVSRPDRGPIIRYAKSRPVVWFFQCPNCRSSFTYGDPETLSYAPPIYLWEIKFWDDLRVASKEKIYKQLCGGPIEVFHTLRCVTGWGNALQESW